MKMKVSDLKKIIKEEIKKALGEVSLPDRTMQPGEEVDAIGAEVPDLSSEEQKIIDAMGGGETLLRQDGTIEYRNEQLSVLMPDEIKNRLQKRGIIVDKVMDIDEGAWSLEGIRM